MSDIQKLMYAICATAFFMLAAYGLITYGEKPTQVMTIFALILAGASQFIAQNENPRAYGMAWVFIIIGALNMVLALLFFAVTS